MHYIWHGVLLFAFALYFHVGSAVDNPSTKKSTHKTIKTAHPPEHSSTRTSSKPPTSSPTPPPPTYILKDIYNTTNFFDSFEFFHDPDPSHGTVQYQDKPSALKAGLAATKHTTIPGLTGPQPIVHLGAQSGALSSTSTGRPSIRLTSRKSYTGGLFIADLTHMPAAECAIWPAFWTSKIDTWPRGGEIDIIEGINLQEANQIVLHTGSSCDMNDDNNPISGIPGPVMQCGQEENPSGCRITDKSGASFGEGFNRGGGGVYAMQWTSSVVRVWWWARGKVPGDVADGKPSPQGWGTPVADFARVGKCALDKLLGEHQMVFDITFCGDWAGQKGAWGAQCAKKYGDSCSKYVMGSKDGFQQAYWEIVSVKVYQSR